MACGCTSACGCNIVGDHETAEVSRTGDTFTVSAIIPIRLVADTDCLHLEVDTDTATLTGAPILATATGPISLECTADGLAADLLLDPDSTAILSQGAGGLKVDVPTVSGSGSSQVGSYMDYAGVRNPIGYVEASGQSEDRDAYPELLDELTLFAESATRTSGSPVVSGIDSTRFITAGMTAEIDGFGTPLTVLSVDGPNTITVSSNAADSDSGSTMVRVFVYGDGDGDGNSFSVPNANGCTKVTLDNQGGTDAGRLSVANTLGLVFGGETIDLVAANLPLHTVSRTGSAGASTAISGGAAVATSGESGHTHGPGTSGRAFVMAGAPTTTQTTSTGGAGVITVGGGGAEAPGDQLNNNNTGLGSGHTHTVSTVNIAAQLAAATSVDLSGVSWAGGQADPDGVSRVQPSILVRTFIKT